MISEGKIQCQFEENMMDFPNDNRLSLIQKISEEMDGLGLESVRPAIQRHVEKTKTIKKPLDLASLI